MPYTARKGRCPVCGRLFTITSTGKIRAHKPADPDGLRCPGTGQDPKEKP